METCNGAMAVFRSQWKRGDSKLDPWRVCKNNQNIYNSTQNGCRVDVSPTDVSPTESSWMLRPLDKTPLDIVPLTDVSQPWTTSHIDGTMHEPHNAWVSRRKVGLN